MVLSPVYTLLGEEELLKESAFSKVKKKCFFNEKDAALSFNYVSLDGKSTTNIQIIEECQQLPFMSNNRLVIVKDADKILDDKLLEYIKRPVETTCLVLFIRKLDRRLETYKVLKRYTEIEEFDHPDKKEIAGWIQQYVRDNKKYISAGDASFIASSLENNLTGILQELEKLITFIGNRINIDKNDIETIIYENKLKDSFALTEAIQDKDTSGAIKLINTLLDQGNSVPQIIGTIRWMLTRLWQAKDGNKEDLNIPSFFLNKFIKQADKFSIEELKIDLIKLLAVEKFTRTYTIPENLVLELLVIQLTENTTAFVNG